MTREESRQKGWLSLLQESINNSKIKTYNPNSFTIEDMEKQLKEYYSEDNMRARRKRFKEVNDNAIATYLYYKDKK